MGHDFDLTICEPIWRIFGRFVYEIISEECDLSDGEVWECVSTFLAPKAYENFWHSSHKIFKNVDKILFWKINVFLKFCKSQQNLIVELKNIQNC